VKSILNVLNSLFIIGFLASCSTDIDYRMPANRFQGPEALGKTLGIRGDLTYKGGHKVNLAEVSGDILSDSADVNSDSNIDRSRGLGLDGRLGIVAPVDIFYSVNDDGPSVIGLKYQFLGDSGGEGVKLAIGGGYGSGKEDKAVTIGNTQYTVDLDLVSMEGFVSLGYRANQHVMAYLTGFYSEYTVDATLDANGSTDLTIDGYSRSSGVMGGLELSKGSEGDRTVLTNEGGYTIGKYKGLKESGDFVYGFSLGRSI
jgi:hypothetical protein